MPEQQFFDTVISQFNKKGVKFTLDEVASALRTSKRTIYEKYGSKENVLMLTVNRYFEALKKQEEQIIENTQLDIIEKIRQTITLFPPMHIDFNYMEDVRRVYPAVHNEIINQFEANWDNTFALIEEAFKQNRLKVFDLAAFKIIFLGVFQELMGLDEAVQREKQLMCLDLILDGYKTGE